ncbi:hypothetical protein PMIN01_08645 [Paraphaeosphaeria minitans]|uniref:Uncharacterized protein n=1 Tax=Paraphaeosphaeria minitans TaxID=565426 RepID=A0A9P6GCW0_9PLEO|nr:hypothetical protein PMIN01_08645 [Paraphaeosphaeria minitans]
MENGERAACSAPRVSAGVDWPGQLGFAHTAPFLAGASPFESSDSPLVWIQTHARLHAQANPPSVPLRLCDNCPAASPALKPFRPRNIDWQVPCTSFTIPPNLPFINLPFITPCRALPESASRARGTSSRFETRKRAASPAQMPAPGVH